MDPKTIKVYPPSFQYDRRSLESLDRLASLSQLSLADLKWRSSQNIEPVSEERDEPQPEAVQNLQQGNATKSVSVSSLVDKSKNIRIEIDRESLLEGRQTKSVSATLNQVSEKQPRDTSRSGVETPPPPIIQTPITRVIYTDVDVSRFDSEPRQMRHPNNTFPKNAIPRDIQDIMAGYIHEDKTKNRKAYLKWRKEKFQMAKKRVSIVQSESSGRQRTQSEIDRNFSEWCKLKDRLKEGKEEEQQLKNETSSQGDGDRAAKISAAVDSWMQRKNEEFLRNRKEDSQIQQQKQAELKEKQRRGEEAFKKWLSRPHPQSVYSNPHPYTTWTVYLEPQQRDEQSEGATARRRRSRTHEGQISITFRDPSPPKMFQEYEFYSKKFSKLPRPHFLDRYPLLVARAGAE